MKKSVRGAKAICCYVPYYNPANGGGLIGAEEFSTVQILLDYETALALLQLEKRNSGRHTLACTFAWSTTVLMLITSVAFIAKAGISGVALSTFLCLLTSLVIAVYACVLALRPQPDSFATSTVDDIRLIGPLLDRYALVSGQRLKTTTRLLTRLLAKITPETEIFLTSNQKRELTQSLQSPLPLHDVQYTLAVLHAVSFVGNEYALWPVRCLASLEGHSEEERVLRDGARECLPRLEALIESQKKQAGLLLPSGANRTAPEMMVRPVNYSPLEDGDQLLRAGTGLE